MIGSLRGRIIEVHASWFLLETQGVGYCVKAAAPTLSHIKAGEECFVYIHDHVREDARDLYGFLQWSEQEFFERLLSVSGVGPKVALTIMSAGSLEAVRRAVMQGDLTLLTSVSGVGKKTAQKIILDLKGQLVDEEGQAPGDGEVVEALLSLGYSAQIARSALRSVPTNIADVSARIREALKYLAK